MSAAIAVATTIVAVVDVAGRAVVQEQPGPAAALPSTQAGGAMPA